MNKIISALPFFVGWFGLSQYRSVGFPGGSVVKTASQCRRRGFDPCVGKIRWRRTRQPTPVFLPGVSQGQGSLVGYNPEGCKESDTTERLSMQACSTDQRGKSQSLLYFCFFLSLCLFFFLSVSFLVSQ